MSTARMAAIGGITFTVLFGLHHVLQGAGPAGSAAEVVAAYDLAHRTALLASEVAVGLALLAFIAFVAPLATLIRQARQETLATATIVAGTTFIAMGFLSTAAETALIGVAQVNQPGAVDALNYLQGRTPNVWATAALVAIVTLALGRGTGWWRWLRPTGFVLTAIFLLASISSLVGRGIEGGYSLIGVALFLGWMIALSANLWVYRAAD